MSDPTAAGGLYAILEVDQVGSTRFLMTHGEVEADRVLSELDDAVRSIVDALGGAIEACTGDGYIASFGLGTAALDAAVEIQRAARRLSSRYPEPVEMRAGLAIGEVHRDGNLRGWPLYHASRLCDAAPDGGILASRTLLDAVATRSNHLLGEVHRLDLKGLDQPSEAVEIDWALPDEVGEATLHPELAVVDRQPFVGQDGVVESLLAAVTAPDPPRLVVLAGEPGVGKSRLIARFAAEAAGSGHAVMYGSAPRERHSSQVPVVAALRAVLESLRPEVRGSVLAGTPGRELSRLLPDLGGPGRELLHPTDGPGADRLLLEGIAETLERLAAHGKGLTFVVDDLQWADATTLDTVRHLAGPDGPAGVVVVGVIRTADLPTVTSLIADASRGEHVMRLELTGLERRDIAALIGAVAPSLDVAEADEKAARLAARTDGNALFVTSIVQQTDWIDADAADPDERELPPELTVAIAEQLAGLDEADTEALTAAAVIGQRFPGRLLADVVGRSPDAVAATVRRGRERGLLQDLGDGDIGFVHDLVRVALMPPESGFERSALHRSIAEQLAQEPDPDPGATATHFVEGLAAGSDRDKTADWSGRAAGQSMRRLDYQQAARRYRAVVDILGQSGEWGLTAMVDLGRAQLLAGDPTYRETLLEAVDGCLDADRPGLAAEAALANNRGLYSVAGEVDRDRIVALERVLEAGHDPAVRSRLLATLAVESVFSGASGDDLAALSREAVDLARRSGDDDALAHALTLRQDANYRIDNLGERLDETDELLGLTAGGDPSARFWAVAHRATAVGEAGGWDEVARLIDEAEAIAAATRAPVLEWYAAVLRGAQAIQRGELREAQGIIDRAFELGVETGQPDALIPTSGQQCEVLRRRGRYDTIFALANENLNADLLRRSAPMRAVLLLEQGREDEACRLWESVGFAGALDVPAAQIGHNLLHARRLASAFGDTEAAAAVDEALAGVPPFLFCNYWEPTTN